MQDTHWILLDTETTGFAAPVFVVEIAAQRMKGWEPVGAPFRRLLNQNADIPPEASRVHGYTREILERDGEPAAEAYESLRAYTAGLPLVSYNTDYDLEHVLKPEWKRLGIPTIGASGLCALRLAQRLLDPVPAGNCKLQTLRQYYRLPERGAHTALGDVQTVSDLFATVLRPIAELRGLTTWAQLVAYAGEEWYPSRIAFGRHKGKSIMDAAGDALLRGWLEGLAKSENARNARMGRWYLRRLQEPEAVFVAWEKAEGSLRVEHARAGLVVYVNPEVKRLKTLVEAARGRLADLEAGLTVERAVVEAMKARLFTRLREHFQRRDRLRAIVHYRRRFIELLTHEGEEEAAQVQEEYRRVSAQTEQDYENAAASMSGKKELTVGEAAEVSRLWRKLVRLYHPDRFAHEPETQETYHRLTAAINQAKESGNLATLRMIADDPLGFILRQGWAALDFSEEEQIAQLRRLWENVELEIVRVIETLAALRESQDYELHRLTQLTPGFFDEVVLQHLGCLDLELTQLQTEADLLEEEIVELTGAVDPLTHGAHP